MADGEVKIVIDAEDNDAAKKLEDIEEQAEKTGDKVEDLGDKSGKGSKGLDILNISAGNLVADGIKSLISGLGDAVISLVNLADETREFREDMAKLKTAFTDAGHSPEAAQKAYEDFYAILGESDRSVEAVNHLAELTDNTEELSKWSTIAAGVTAKFGDSLPIEGLTEAANETAKVGAVTGPLADALNWAGISEDKFNEALKKCNSEQERATLITNTLNKEYADAAAEYNTLTASTQAARRATAEMEAAQARLGAAVEPFATMITTAKTALFNMGATLAENVITNIDKAKEATTFLNAEERALVDNSLAAAEQLRELKAAADETAEGIYSQFNHTKSLADELFRLVDANGVVAEADKARVEFILGELNEALGTEYTMTGNIIGNYTKLRDSIYETIEAKRAQILLQQYEEGYAEAVKNLASQEEARATQAIALTEAVSAVEAAELEAKKIRAEAEKSLLEDGSRTNAAYWNNRIQGAEGAVTREKANLDEVQKKYDETDAAVEGSLGAINSYEQASTLILQGETDKAIEVLNNYGNGFSNTASTVDEANKKELASLEKKVINTSIELGKLEKEYNEQQGNMTAEQKKEMEARIEAAKKEAQDARAEFKTVGGDMVEGLAEGVDEKDGSPIWNLAGKLKNIVARAIQGAKDEAEIKSPSRKMRKEVGRELIDGAVLGVEDRQKSFMNTMKDVVGGAVEEAKNGADATVKALEEAGKKAEKAIEDQLEELSDKRTTANAKQIDAQKKALNKELKALREKNKEELEIAKERQKANSDFAREYERYLTQIEKLEEDYATNSAKIQEKLTEDINKAHLDYANLFDSRVQSIKSSLNLFEKVEKSEAVKKSDLTNALTSQVKELEKYNTTVNELSARFEGDESGFLEEMLGLGVDYLPELQAINRMTDKELEKYVDLWKKKNQLATDAAITELAGAREELQGKIKGLQETAKKDAETLKNEYNAALLELTQEVGVNMAAVGEKGLEELGNQLTDYATTGKGLMDSIAEGMENGESKVISTAVSIVEKAIMAAQKAAGIEARLTTTVNAETAKFGASSKNSNSIGAELANAAVAQAAGINRLAGTMSTGSKSQTTVVIELDKRELGRAVVDVGSAENVRVGSKLALGGA